MDYQILHSDNAIRCADMLNRECLKMTGDPELKICCPVDRDHVLRKFNDGFFHEILMRFKVVNGEREWPIEHLYSVFLGVYAMALGVKIENEDMDILRSALRRVLILGEPKKQIEKAFQNYKSNGEE